MEQCTLEKMLVSKVLLPEKDWIAFLGYSNTDQQTAKNQEVRVFSQSDLSQCLYTFEAEDGGKITDIAELGLDTLAIAQDDGSVHVKLLKRKACLEYTLSDSYENAIILKEIKDVLDSNLDKVEMVTKINEISAATSRKNFTVENFATKQHGSEKIDKIVYCGSTPSDYCAASGATIYSGS